MIEIAIIVLLVLALLGVAATWNSVRDAAAGLRGRLDEVETRLSAEQRTLLAEAEKRLQSDVRAAREGHEASLRQLSDSVGARFDAFGDRQTESLARAASQQEQRLEKVDVALREFADRSQRQNVERTEAANAAFAALQERIAESLARFGAGQTEAHATARRELAEALTALRKSQDEAREAQKVQFAALQEQVRLGLDAIRADNERRLETIRATVDEKLQGTLEKRLGESFRIVGERLEQVHRGLGEMQNLAQGVGDLKRVLSNVRARGTFGETQLAALLEQVLVPSQFERNVATVPGSAERVEFAVRLPGRGDGDEPVLLPIDAKFPQEDYLRLQQAWESGDAAALDEARKALRARILEEGRRIRAKYVAPPRTTDFAILFLPTEGLYAEVLRLDGVAEKLQTESQIAIAGPTTLFAILNSLQMGFRTLAIQQRSGEVWKVLGAVKTEFAKFGVAIDAVGRKLDEARNKIDATMVRSRALERKLRDVEELPEGEAKELLPDLFEEDPRPADETSR